MNRFTPFLLATLCALASTSSLLRAQPMVERLSRGVVAVPQSDGSVFISWRLLADDPDGVGFNVYRETAAVANAQGDLFAAAGLSRSGAF